MKRVLVTGAAGFLGSHLVNSLLEDGSYVIGIDNLSTGRMQNIHHLVNNPNFEFIYYDVTIPYNYDVDEIWNLACPASPIAYQLDKYKTLMTSIKGVENALNCALRNSKRNCKVFQSSTSEIYGDPTVHPQPESYWGNVNTVGPRSNYDEGKRVAETMLTDFSNKYGVPVKIARIFNTYGPNMDPMDGRVVSNFIMQALEYKPFTVYGSGSQTRSFCYVSDLIAGFRKLMETPDSFIQPVNLGNPIEFTMIELIDKIEKKIKTQTTIIFKDLPGDDPRRRCPDISLANQILGWYPRIMLDEGLEKTIAYFRSLTK